MASPVKDKPLWVRYPDSPADLESHKVREASFDELTCEVHELLQTRRSNREVALLFDNASSLSSEKAQVFSSKPFIDPGHHILPDRESARSTRDLFGDKFAFDDLLAMPTPIDPQQGSIMKWLESTMPPAPKSTPLRSPKPIFDANFSSFLHSPTVSAAEHPESTTSEYSEREIASGSTPEYEPDQLGYASHVLGQRLFGEPTHIYCHSHNGIFHGDRNCPCRCGSHCDFLRRNSKRRTCECNCPCHKCFQPCRQSPETATVDRLRRDSIDDHFESLDIAERGGVSSRSESWMSYHTAPVRHEVESHYLDHLVQSQVHGLFRFPLPDSQIQV